MARILVAEDDRVVRTLIRMSLDSGGAEILEAEDGEEALALARRELPDLVLLDWLMPGLSGVEVCRVLRGDPATAAIKVVILTARTDRRDREAGFEAGADDYITKPFSPAQLLDKVREVLGPDALIPAR